MTDKPYTDADVERLTALVRARIGWPVSAGEAGTIVTVVLQELAAADWRPPTRTPILYVDAIVGQVTDEMVTAYKRAYAAAWKAAAPVTTQGEATSVERDAVRAGLAAVSQISLNAPAVVEKCPCTCHQPDRCPCTPGTPKHHHGAGGYCTVSAPTPDSSCTCPNIDVTSLGERPGSRTMPGLDRRCPLHGDQADHVIAFADDGTWSLEHPLGCRRADLDFDCPVRVLAARQIPADLAQLMAGGRYTCSAGTLGDLFQLGERLHDDQCTTPVCAACGCWCHAEEQAEG